MKTVKKIAIGLAAAASAGIIGGVTVTHPLNGHKDETPGSPTTDVIDPAAGTLSPASPVQPTPLPGPSSPPAASPAPANNRPPRIKNPTSETIGQTGGNQVTVVKYQEIIIDADTSDCLYTYSDNTTYQFRWKTTDPNGGVQTLPNGTVQIVPVVSYDGVCDYSAIGLPKS